MTNIEQRTDRRCFLLIIVLGLLAQCLLILNPGYFSHDELQYAAISDSATLRSIDWFSWTQVNIFQYRPLTFNLWLFISHFLFNHPRAFHGLWVLFGTLEGGLIFLLLRRLAVARTVAVVAALAFVLNPYAAFTLGWVATLADLLWVGAALLLGWLLLRCEQDSGSLRWAVFWTLVLTAVALLAKESGIVIPALLAIAWLLSTRKTVWRTAMLISALPVLIYLVLRLHVILFAPRASTTYQWSIGIIPLRWIEYQLYPLLPSVFEMHNLWLVPASEIALASIGYGVLLWALWQSHRRAALFFVLGGAAALGPVLLLESTTNHYGYGFFAVIAGSVAVAYRSLSSIGRLVLIPILAVVFWHGVNSSQTMYAVGKRQALFSPDVAIAVAFATSTPIKLYPSETPWTYARLIHDIPSYHGVKIGDRVRLVDSEKEADYVIATDGSLHKYATK